MKHNQIYNIFSEFDHLCSPNFEKYIIFLGCFYKILSDQCRDPLLLDLNKRSPCRIKYIHYIDILFYILYQALHIVVLCTSSV